VKSFRDRNPILIGLGSIAIIAVLVNMAFAVGLLHVLERAYTVRAEFADASGIRGGDDVRVAGVKAGRVVKVKPEREKGLVIIEFKVNDDVDLGRNTTAEVALGTLLGTKFLRLSGPVTKPYLKDMASDERLIPIERTKTPFDVFELTTIGTRSVQATDTEKLNRLIQQLAAISENKQDSIRELLEGISRFSTALSSRDAELRSLLDRADQLSALLAEKDETLTGLIDESQGVLALVKARRSDIVRGLRSANSAIGQVAGLLAAHENQLDFVLDTLHPTIDIIDRRQGDIDRALSWLGLGALGLSRATTHGPWADIYVRDIQVQLVGLICNVFNPEDPGACL
jgi:phospholipid/cholesterol/gamma-HCH transport system substrate-binding protein